MVRILPEVPPSFALSRAESEAANACARCGMPASAENIRDELERRELEISRICGLCWDALFADEGE